MRVSFLWSFLSMGFSSGLIVSCFDFLNVDLIDSFHLLNWRLELWPFCASSKFNFPSLKSVQTIFFSSDFVFVMLSYRDVPFGVKSLRSSLFQYFQEIILASRIFSCFVVEKSYSDDVQLWVFGYASSASMFPKVNFKFVPRTREKIIRFL